MYMRAVPLLAALTVLLALETRVGAASPTSPDTSCTLEYQRADNMWAAQPNLGWESITLQLGQSKTFITDWAYEKLRNDGIRYYGSHLRIATNRGTRHVKFRIVNQITWAHVSLPPGETAAFKADISRVWCE